VLQLRGNGDAATGIRSRTAAAVQGRLMQWLSA
jgi:hypothetical protein